MERKIRIVAIEAAEGAAPYKVRATFGKGIRWEIPIVYVLADGRRISSRDTFGRRRDALEHLAKLPKHGIRNMAAYLDESDRLRGTLWTPIGELSDSEVGPMVAPPAAEPVQAAAI